MYKVTEIQASDVFLSSNICKTSSRTSSRPLKEPDVCCIFASSQPQQTAFEYPALSIFPVIATGWDLVKRLYRKRGKNSDIPNKKIQFSSLKLQSKELLSSLYLQWPGRGGIIHTTGMNPAALSTLQQQRDPVHDTALHLSISSILNEWA